MKLSSCFLLPVALLAATAAGNGQVVSLLHVEVTDLQPVYEMGHAITFRPVGTPPRSLHVRVFFDSIAKLKRTRPDSDHCIPFYTTILWGTGHPGLIQLDPINTGALYNRGRASAQGSTVTLVFEAGDQAEVGAFRLKPEAVTAPDGYFRYAIEIRVAPSTTEATVEHQVTEAVVEGLRNEQPAITLAAEPQKVTNPPKPPCYTVKRAPRDEAVDPDAVPGMTLVATMAPVGCDAPAIPGALPVNPAGF